MSEYPEHDKMAATAAESQAIGAFLDSGRYVLAEWAEDDSGRDILIPVGQPITKVLAEHFGIDLTKVEAEKRAMLASIRAVNQQ